MQYTFKKEHWHSHFSVYEIFLTDCDFEMFAVRFWKPSGNGWGMYYLPDIVLRIKQFLTTGYAAIADGTWGPTTPGVEECLFPNPTLLHNKGGEQCLPTSTFLH